MGKIDVWMPIYIGDYLRDTTELTAEEHGAYLLLLMHYWLKNGEIGAEIGRITRVCKTQEETARFLLGSFFTLVDGNYRNKRADEELEKANLRRAKATENGKRGGRKPKNNPGETGGYTGRFAVGIPESNPEHNPGESSSPSPSPSNKEDIILAPLAASAQPSKTVTASPSAVAVATKPKKLVDHLYAPIWESFISRTPAMANYPAQGKAVNRLIEFIRQHAARDDPDAALELSKQLVTKYWNLLQSGDRFWRQQPFTPMNLASPGILDRVIHEIQATQPISEVDYDSIPF